ncbi:MAG: aspartate aminotransferase family protein [Eubacterium sp.]|nr:aspartate aminotransferase family protein [Eubacterium sp.]
MNTEVIKEKTEAYALHTYNRFPVAFTEGKGVYLYDAEGNKYLDFAAGIAVMGLGHAHPVFTAAMQDQVGKLIHTSNLYYHDTIAEAAEKLIKASGMNKVFFTNSGTEAIEGAIKAARKYAWMKDGSTDHEIIAMRRSFHGRSLGALSVTGNDHYQEPFKPLIGGIRFADFNDIESVKAVLNEKTIAVLLEPVQGEGGVFPAEEAFLKELREICDEKDILLVFDEIQCGMGRCGEMFAWQKYGVKPDILTSAKALGCGFPVGAFLLNEKAAEKTLVPGDHGTTYGGNPLACRAVSTVFDIFEKEDVIGHVQKLTPYLEKTLDKLVEEVPCFAARRGMGFLQGIVVEGEAVGNVIQNALKEGLLVISAEGNVLRLAPPLVAGATEIDAMAVGWA